MESLARRCCRVPASGVCRQRIAEHRTRGHARFHSRVTGARRRSAFVARGLPAFVDRDTSSSVDEQIASFRQQRGSNTSSSSSRPVSPSGEGHWPISYEIVKGPLAKFSDIQDSAQVPTAVLVHGILGSGRNLRSFARKLARENPAWQFLLVDLRCHGESASARTLEMDARNSVDGAAADVLQLLKSLNLFPKMLIGHSFGGKVVMKMVDQFGSKALPRPVQVWVLDTVPGDVRAAPDVADHPRTLIDTLLQVPLPIRSPNLLVEGLRNDGFSFEVAAWVATNLTMDASGQGYTWSFDLKGIKQMYESYESSDLWNVVECPPQGLSIDFVKAERSTFRWGGADHHRIESNGAQVHMLEDAGHWVHTDNPEGLLEIMKSSFG